MPAPPGEGLGQLLWREHPAAVAPAAGVPLAESAPAGTHSRVGWSKLLILVQENFECGLQCGARVLLPHLQVMGLFLSGSLCFQWVT